MTKLHKRILIVVIIVVACLVAAIVILARTAPPADPEVVRQLEEELYGSPPPVNTDPMKGRVEVNDPKGDSTGLFKFCDGYVLVYTDNLWKRLGLVSNSRECGA